MGRLRDRGLLSLILGCLLASCGGGGGPSPRPTPPVPQGFVAATGRHYAFVRPRDWRPIQADAGAPGKVLVGFESSPGPSGLPSQVGIGIDPRYPHELRDAVRLAKDESRIVYPGYRITAEKTFPLDGAQALRIDAEYASFQDEPRPVRTVDVLAQTPEGVQLNFFVRGPAEDFDRLGLTSILDSFRIRG